MSEQQQTVAAQQPWPEGVLFRFLNLVGATVDLRQAATGPNSLQSECTGCGTPFGPDHNFLVKQAAQQHAETCRALPRPEVTA
jgi:hypothetical protein